MLVRPFTSGGIILWSKSYTPQATTIVSSAGSPINALIKDVLVEGRSGDGPGPGRESYESGGWKMEWTVANGLDLIFVVSTTRSSVPSSALVTVSGRRELGSLRTEVSLAELV